MTIDMANKENPKSKGLLAKHASLALTPMLGTEFPTARLVEWIKDPNSDDLIRELAILGSITSVTWSNQGVVELIDPVSTQTRFNLIAHLWG